MTKIQKLIKNIALAFAIFLVVVIFSGILGVCALIFRADEPVAEATTTEIVADNLKIDLYAANLKIKTGETFTVTTDNPRISVNTVGTTLTVKEKKKNLFSVTDNYSVVITLPAELKLNNAEIDAGAGRIEIENLTANVFELDLGAGQTDIDNVTAQSKTEINGGAGKININDCTFNNLELDMGVGELEMTAAILGRSKAELGVGNVDILLLGAKEDYLLETEKGIGEITVDGQQVKDNAVTGSGANRIEIEGGVGKIDIDFK